MTETQIGQVKEIHNGDSMDWLRTIEPGSVDMLLTDPPYSSGGAFRGDRNQKTSRKYQTTNVADVKPEFYGDTRDQRSMERWFAEWLRLSWHAMRDGGIAAVFIDWRNVAVAIDAIQEAGFVYRGLFSWCKTNTRPQPGMFAASCEYVVLGTKGAVDRSVEKYPKGFWEGMPPTTAQRIHATEKPVQLLEYLLQLVPDGGLVIDPFAGSGSTGEAAHRMGLRFLGCELSEEYAEMANRRLESVQAQGMLAL